MKAMAMLRTGSDKIDLLVHETTDEDYPVKFVFGDKGETKLSASRDELEELYTFLGNVLYPGNK